MSIEDNKRIALDWLENFANFKNSPGYVEAHAHDDVEFVFVADPETFPRAALGPMNKAQLIASMERVKELFPDGFKFDIDVVTAEENRVVVEGTAHAVRKDSGRVVTNRGCGVYEIKDGKVWRHRSYEDTAMIMSLWAEEAEYITPWK